MMKTKSIKMKLIKIVSFIMMISFLLPLVMEFANAEEEVEEALLEDRKNVLFISSYQPSFVTFYDQLDGIKDRFGEQPIILDVEFMDSKRFYTDENITNFHDSLKYKLDNGLIYDAVIVGDDNGLVFVMENKEELFGDIPIFFMGINNAEYGYESSLDPLVTGVLEAKSMEKTVEFALDINHEAKRVVAIHDQTTSSLGEYNELEGFKHHFPDIEFVDVDTSTLTEQEYIDFLSSLTEEEIAYFLSPVSLEGGIVLHAEENYEYIIEHASQPLYSTTISGIGDGLFGGKVVMHYAQGYAAADMVMEYLLGTPISEIEFSQDSPNKYVVDYTMFKEFHYDDNDLPADVEFVNRDYTFFEMYRTYVLIAIGIMLFQLFIIVLLIDNIRARRRTQQGLYESQEEVQQMNEELQATVDELHYTNRELEDSIKEVNERESTIRKMVYVDELTGLMTKYAFSEVLEGLIKDNTNKMAIALVDIDDFKHVNDSFGHEQGDKVIQAVGKKLADLQVGKVEVCRYSGDEFLLLLNNVKSHVEVDYFAESIKTLFEEPIMVNNRQFFITLSTGVAVYPEHGKNIEELMVSADMALHESKNVGKDTYTIFNKTMDTKIHDKLSFQNILRNGFKNEEFYMNYQPLIGAEAKATVGYEALIRWNSPELGFVSPYKLITEAEEMGLIIKIGEWIIRQACIFIKDLEDESRYVSVNISAVQLLDGGFVSKVIDIVNEYGIDPGRIYLEMTETALIDDLDVGGTIIKELYDYGFKISLDDFGTGYSSLSYLKNLTIDVLKIDKSFIDNITLSNYDKSLVEAIVKIALQRNIKIVAEGVESKEQYETLKELGVHVIQGYYFSRPLASGDAKTFVIE